ncbi:hypothetical protein LPJ66_009539 [Kickxella alabastrina]|uniref:Uncharacterized protein n=1 Tax=Kickxella alabastrina TaxID=61397 RepID=A0ACC1I3L3_9FUNG|nr:hypothetical protein LPJ66_009539 [Kickxella alabastrina]
MVATRTRHLKGNSGSTEEAAAATDLSPATGPNSSKGAQSGPISSRPKRRSRPSVEEITGFAPIPEALRPNLDILFVGINPGIISGQKQLHFGNPQNFFWKGLFQSGLIPEQIQPEQGHLLFDRWNMSIVNLVQRTTASTSDLSRKEMRDAVPKLCRKISANPPRIVCFVGKGIYEVYSAQTNFALGLQQQRLAFAGGSAVQLRSGRTLSVSGSAALPKFAHLFVMPSTSGRTAAYQNAEKLMYFKQLKYIRDCCCSNGNAAEELIIDHGVLDAIGPRTRSQYFPADTE